MNPRLCAALLLLFASLKPVPAQSSVWKITRDKTMVFLGATCPMLRPTDAPWPAEFDAAYAAAQVLVFETDLALLQKPETQAQIVQLGRHGPDGSLQHDLTPETWTEVEAYCAKGNVPLGAANRLRPWFFSFMVTELELQKLGVTDEGVDRHYHNRGHVDQKTFLSLETFEQRLHDIIHLGAGQEDALVRHSLREAGEFPQTIAAVVAAWRMGDLPAMDELHNASLRQNLPQVFDTLIVQRSRAWLPQIAALLETDVVEFVIIDGGHLPGPDGLIAGLTAEGCTAEQLRVATTDE